jgi:hypothetical protein
MNKEARKLWQTPNGLDMLRQMLKGQPLTPPQRDYLEEMKKVDPPTLRQPSPDDATGTPPPASATPHAADDARGPDRPEDGAGRLPGHPSRDAIGGPSNGRGN